MSNILTGFNMQGNDPIDDRIVSKSNLETLEQYLKRVPVQKRYYGLTFFALDKNNELRKYTFQTSLINPTIDDNEEEIERIDKELQEHVSDKSIHKTSEEIRSEIVDADIPDTIARVQWTLDQINTAVINLIGGASDEYNTLKRIQTKIEELRAKIYGDGGSTVLNTLEQALKFLNQYKDFIVDIPENFVNKQDIVDNLTTDDPTKVLSAKQGKVLSDTLTNYFESAMQSIRTETDRAINAENRIETKLDKEIDRSIKEDQRIDAKLDAEIKRSTDEDLRIDSKLDSEINRSTTEDDRLDKKIDAETTRATDAESNLNTKIETETDRAESEESRIETKLDNEIARSTNKDTEHDNRLTALEGDTHEQNTDLGTTNSTFQLKYNTGNKIKHESDAVSVRNAADTDYVNFIAKNATFKGDLLVEGQSFVTEAETVEIKDNLLLLNKGEVGAGVTKGIAGLEIDRGTEPNYQIIFDESDNRFKAGEIGDIQCLALRDGDNSMVNGMFTTWDSSTKRLKTTNIVPSSSLLYFGDNKKVALSYNNSEGLSIYNGNNALAIFPTANNTTFRCTGNNFQLVGKLITLNETISSTFKRGSDNSEVLYHADIVNNLTSGGTNKVLSAEQGKLLQNSITSIQGSYLPLSGGTMTGSINLPSTDPLKMIISGSVDSILSYWPSNNAIEFGNNKRKIFLRTDNSNIIHYINGSSYSIYDAYNLPDPVTLSGNNTFTGNNTFQEGKFNVGPFKVTSSGSLFLDISSQAESAWSRSITFRANSDPTSDFVFGGFNSINDTSIGYAYIGVGDVNYSTAQYKFYSGRLEVPMIWRLIAGSNNILNVNLENNFISLGSVSSSSYIVSNNSDLKHRRFTTTSAYKDYIVWDSYNLPTPANTTDLANYLPLIGGKLTSTSSAVLTIDSTGANETYMRVSRNGTSSAAIGFMDGLGAYIYNNNSSRYLFIGNDGYARVGTTSGSTRIALITDIPSVSGYATQSWVNTQLDSYVAKSGSTMTGALTMSSRRNNVVIDVVGGGGNSWNQGAGALSVQIPYDSGQTPLLLARRSGAAIDTTTAAERLLSMELLNTGNTFRITLSNTSTFQLDLSTAKGFLFGKTIATTDQIPSIPSISISNSGSGNAVTSVTANGHTLTVTKGATYLTSSSLDGYATQTWVNNKGYLTSHQTIYNLTFQAGTFAAKTFDPNGAAATVNIPTKTSHITNDSGFITSSALSGYATQSWANGQFAPLSRFNISTGYTTIKVTGQEFNFDSANPEIYMNYRTLSGSTAVTKITWKGGSNSTLCEGRWGNLYMNDNLVATQSWAAEKFPNKTGTGASGTWGISITGNATTATTASKLGSTTIGGSAKPIYLSSGTPTACSATVGSATVPVYMNAGTITQCSTTLGVSITGNAATATNATQLGGTAASSYVKANDNISRLTNDSGYTTQEWVNGQGFLTSDSILDKFVPTTGGYIRNSDQVLLRLQRTGVSTGTSRTIEMYFDDSNTDGTSTTPRGSIGYNSEVGMFLYSAMSKSFIAMEYTGRPFYGTPKNRYYLLGTNKQYHDLDGYQRIGNIMIQWGYFTVQANSTRAVNFPISFTNTVWSVTGSWDNTSTGSQENWGFTNYTSSGFTIINGDGSNRIFHYIAIGPFTGS